MALVPQRIPTLVARALTSADPMAALEAVTALRRELDLLERAQVARALEAGHTFTSIAKPLAISRQGAHRRYRDLSPTPPPPQPSAPTLSVEARMALLRARQEAARHGAWSIDSEHLLLAVARTGSLRLDVDAARRSFAAPAVNAAEPGGLRPSLHARLSSVTGPLGLDHLLRAALEDPGGGAQRVLDHLGIQPQTMLDSLPTARLATGN
jgi:hypothetical protein